MHAIKQISDKHWKNNGRILLINVIKRAPVIIEQEKKNNIKT